MRYKIKSYISLGRGQTLSRDSKEQWEALRTSKRNKAYCIESDIDSYENNCRHNLESKCVARILDKVLGNRNWHIVSIGVGKANLEWHLKARNPKLHLFCADYTGQALLELQKVFISCDGFLEFDMLKDDWGRLNNFDFILLNRVNTEFSFNEWREIYRRMSINKIRRIIFIPCGFGSIHELYLNLKNIFNKNTAKISWCYTESEFLRMWKTYYRVVKKISFNDSAVYFLELKQG